MRYEIEAGGRLRHVSVSRRGDGFAVDVDGRLLLVDAVRVDAQTLSLIVDSGVPLETRTVYETVVVPASGGAGMIVQVGNVAVPVTASGRRARRSDGGGQVSGPLRISAPMPGKVVRVLVEPGQTVGVRQPVVVVEAMKMENALRSDREGTVAEVCVRPGASVEAGTLLVVIL